MTIIPPKEEIYLSELNPSLWMDYMELLTPKEREQFLMGELDLIVGYFKEVDANKDKVLVNRDKHPGK